MNDDAEWLTVSDASRKIGITQQAIRNRVLRGTLDSRRNNRNQLVVRVGSSDIARTQPSIPIELAVSQVTGCQPGIPVDSVSPEINAHIATLKERIADMKADHAREIDRLCSMLVERADAAELRAERAEKIALDALTQAAETAERITASMIQAAERPLWRRIFG